MSDKGKRSISLRLNTTDYERLKTLVTKVNAKRVPGITGRMTISGVVQDLVLEWITKGEGDAAFTSPSQHDQERVIQRSREAGYLAGIEANSELE